MSPITYFEFLGLFVLPPIVGLIALVLYRDETWGGAKSSLGLFVVIGLAVIYTTPWDNLLIGAGVWQYGDGVTTVYFWNAPLGEYLFFVLQPILTGLWLFQFPEIRTLSLRLSARTRLVGVVAGLLVSVVGLLLVGSQSTLYLGAILLWAGPVLALQWGFGWSYLWTVRRTVAIALLVPTLYLAFIDRIAIGLGLWSISPTYTVGITLFGLPIEEALFFLLTNVFIVQAVVLYMWLLDRLNVATRYGWARDAPQTTEVES